MKNKKNRFLANIFFIAIILFAIIGVTTSAIVLSNGSNVKIDSDDEGIDNNETGEIVSLTESTQLKKATIETSSLDSSIHEVTWKISSKVTSDFESIDSISITNERINMNYGTTWRVNLDLIDIPIISNSHRISFNKTHKSWTEEGPGDNHGHSGWDETEKDGRIVIDQHTIPADNQFHQIVNTDVYTGYNESSDEIFESSGYSWSTLTVDAKYDLNSNEFTLLFSDTDGINWTFQLKEWKSNFLEKLLGGIVEYLTPYWSMVNDYLVNDLGIPQFTINIFLDQLPTIQELISKIEMSFYPKIDSLNIELNGTTFI